MHYCKNDVIEKLNHFPNLSILPYHIQRYALIHNIKHCTTKQQQQKKTNKKQKNKKKTNKKKQKQEAPQCDENQVFNDQVLM
jgi:hypothetical protein